MLKRSYVQEAASLTKKSADGTYRVVLITEGEGSTGIYSPELIEKSATLFENVASFINHPIDPAAPQKRDLNSLAGRVSNVTVGEDQGKRALLGDFKPRAEYASLFEEFSDIIGLSIFSRAAGETMPDGRIRVEEFAASDPYRSVDAVVAAGRGGRFKRAEESLRAIESSLGLPEGAKPAAEASAEEKESERMEEKDIAAIATATAAAIAESLAPVLAFVNESAAKKAEKDQTEVDAEALDTARAEGAKAAAESLTAIDAAGLPEKIAEGFKAQVLEGLDVTEAVASAKEVADAVAESAEDAGDDKPGVIVIESAKRKPAGATKSFALKGGRR